MENIQNYFIQITITKGKILQNDDGSTTKETIEIIKDLVECFDLKENMESRAEALSVL